MTQKKIIIVFGKTGAGKSAICNVICGKKSTFKESSDLYSETQQCQSFTNHIFGNPQNQLCQVTDTPGFQDSSGSDINTLLSITDMLSEIKDGLHIGLFCISAADTRCDAGIIQTLTLITQLMNTKVLEHVYIVVTQLNRLSKNLEQQAIEKITRQVPDILKQSNLTLNYSKIFHYYHHSRGNQPHGLEELVQLLNYQQTYKPQVCKDFALCQEPNNESQTILNLTRISKEFQQMLTKMEEQNQLKELQTKQQLEMEKKLNETLQYERNKLKENMDELKQQQKIETDRLMQKFKQDLNKSYIINKELKKQLDSLTLDSEQKKKKEAIDRDEQIQELIQEKKDLSKDIEQLQSDQAQTKIEINSLTEQLNLLQENQQEIQQNQQYSQKDLQYQLNNLKKQKGCFLFGTKIQRQNQENTELISIENIQVGDRILSINKFGDCFYDEVMIIDENKLAKELEIPMTTITYMDKFTNELISLTVTHHHFIHTYQDNKIVSKLSRDLKIGDIIKIVSQDQTMIYQTEIINLEYVFAMNGVKNIVTRESYSVIANSIHCSVHCEGDGGDLLFNVGYYMHLVFGQKAIQLLYTANKAYKSLRRGITKRQE